MTETHETDTDTNPPPSSKAIARRSFLGMASAGAASVVACGGNTTASTRSAPSVSSATAKGSQDHWTAFRSEFALTRERIHLGGLLLASNPKPVREAIDRYRKILDEDPVTTIEHDLHTGEHTNATLDAAARYLGVPREEIALTDSTTSGVAVVYGGMLLRPGDEVITTTHDHFVTHEQLRLASERYGVTIKTIGLYDLHKAAEARSETIVKAIESAITPQTRAIAITYVHSSTGAKMPIRKIADIVAKANAAQSRSADQRILLCVDGVHGFGIENVTMAELGCDFFIAGCHKWLFGPRGTGFVWGRADAWTRLRPQACPFSLEYVGTREFAGGPMPKLNGLMMSPGGFRNFESRWALREAFNLHLRLGKDNVEKRIHQLASQCKAGLASMRHVTLHTPMAPELSSGIVCFEVAAMKPDAVVARLLEGGVIATTTPYQPSFARFTPGLINNPEEIDRALSIVKSFA